MASDKHPTSTLVLSTEPSDPSETHAQLGLPVAQNSRRTTTGFIVDESRLLGYYPTPPGKKDNSSWVWVHGEAITGHKTSTRRWMCRICYDDPVLSRKPFEKWIREAHPVNYAKRHMASHGYDEAGNKAAENGGKRKHAISGVSSKSRGIHTIRSLIRLVGATGSFSGLQRPAYHCVRHPPLLCSIYSPLAIQSSNRSCRRPTSQSTTWSPTVIAQRNML